MKQFLRLLFAPCSEISQRTSMGLDTTLPRSHRVAIGLHYIYCTACRRYRRQIKFIRQALKRLDADALPDESLTELSLPAASRDRLKRFIDDH